MRIITMAACLLVTMGMLGCGGSTDAVTSAMNNRFRLTAMGWFRASASDGVHYVSILEDTATHRQFIVISDSSVSNDDASTSVMTDSSAIEDDDD